MENISDRYAYNDLNLDIKFVIPYKQDLQWLSNAGKLAITHESGGRYKMSALVVKGSGIKMAGKNFYHKAGKTKDPEYDNLGVHAELHALFQNIGGENLRGYTIYISGYTDKGLMNNTKPCKFCMNLIRNTGIRKIVFLEGGKPRKIIIR